MTLSLGGHRRVDAARTWFAVRIGLRGHRAISLPTPISAADRLRSARSPQLLQYSIDGFSTLPPPFSKTRWMAGRPLASVRGTRAAVCTRLLPFASESRDLAMRADPSRSLDRSRNQRSPQRDVESFHSETLARFGDEIRVLRASEFGERVARSELSVHYPGSVCAGSVGKQFPHQSHASRQSKAPCGSEGPVPVRSTTCLRDDLAPVSLVTAS